MIGSSSSGFTHILSLNGRSILSQLAESNVERRRRADTFVAGRGVPIGNYVRPITFIILDKYNVFVSDFYKGKNAQATQKCYLEFCSKREASIRGLRSIIGKHVYCKTIIDDGSEYIELAIEGVTEEGLEKFVRDYAERGTDGFADFIICQKGEVLETIGEYCKRMDIEIKRST